MLFNLTCIQRYYNSAEVWRSEMMLGAKASLQEMWTNFCHILILVCTAKSFY